MTIPITIIGLLLLAGCVARNPETALQEWQDQQRASQADAERNYYNGFVDGKKACEKEYGFSPPAHGNN